MTDFILETGKLDPSYTIPMILTCPSCGERHIDERAFAKAAHHTHACQGCGFVWRPAKVNTHGVRFLPGYNNAGQGTEKVIDFAPSRRLRQAISSFNQRREDYINDSGHYPRGGPDVAETMKRGLEREEANVRSS